jgi:hypothetical protein
MHRHPSRKRKNSVENNETIAGRNGGRLLAGGVRGNKGGTGRPPNVIRQGFRKDLPSEARKLRAHVREMEKLIKDLEPLREDEEKPEARITTKIHDLERLMRARMQLAEFLARYGLGTTVTETDSQGNDTIVIREKREPRILIADN